MTVLAHPLRFYFDKLHPSQTPLFPQGQQADELAEHPLFQRAGAIEIRNADCTSDENDLATEVAMVLEKPFTVGSDAHSIDDLGRQRLPVPAIPSDEGELMDLLRSSPVVDFIEGQRLMKLDEQHDAEARPPRRHARPAHRTVLRLAGPARATRV